MDQPWTLEIFTFCFAAEWTPRPFLACLTLSDPVLWNSNGDVRLASFLSDECYATLLADRHSSYPASSSGISGPGNGKLRCTSPTRDIANIPGNTFTGFHIRREETDSTFASYGRRALFICPCSC